MLPRTLLERSIRLEGDRIVPSYLGERDLAWLGALLDEHVRFEGKKKSELATRLQAPLSRAVARAKLRLAARVLDASTQGRTNAALPPAEARWRLFVAAAGSNESRDVIVERVATEAGVTPAELEAALFADLRGERRVPPLPADLSSPSSLAARANLLLVSSILRRATTVRIVVDGDARDVVRQARRLGLICRVEPGSGEDAVLHVSGPLSLFHHTEIYGRALASLVPRLEECGRFVLTARCSLGPGRTSMAFVLSTGDPVAGAGEFVRCDRRVEERFQSDFRRAAPDWDVIREPAPVHVGGTLVVPDFELVHRHHADERWLVEIVGFWTPEYLSEKLGSSSSGGARLILCVDQRRSCHERDVPEHPQVIRYRTRIDPKAVLRIIGL